MTDCITYCQDGLCGLDCPLLGCEVCEVDYVKEKCEESDSDV